MLRFFLPLFILFTSLQSFAVVKLPKNLDSTEREAALGILGFGSSSKLLASPFPLGGYDGVEVGVNSEYIPFGEVASLGDKSVSRGDLNYLSFVLGKGLFYNVDLILQFIPLPQEESISGFGGQLRWGFYEAKFMPLSFSLVAHGSAINFSSLLGTNTTGLDLVGSVNMRDVSLFFGIGHARSVGTFVGGNEGITDSGNAETSDLFSSHNVFGISIKMSNIFVALEIDRFTQSTYAGKIGARF